MMTAGNQRKFIRITSLRSHQRAQQRLDGLCAQIKTSDVAVGGVDA